MYIKGVKISACSSSTMATAVATIPEKSLLWNRDTNELFIKIGTSAVSVLTNALTKTDGTNIVIKKNSDGSYYLDLGVNIKVGTVQADGDGSNLALPHQTNKTLLTTNGTRQIYPILKVNSSTDILTGQILVNGTYGSTTDVAGRYEITAMANGSAQYKGLSTYSKLCQLGIVTYGGSTYIAFIIAASCKVSLFLDGWYSISDTLPDSSVADSAYTILSTFGNTGTSDSGVTDVTTITVPTGGSSTAVADAISNLSETGVNGDPHLLVVTGTLTAAQLVAIAAELKKSSVQVTLDLSAATVASDAKDWSSSTLQSLFYRCVSLRSLLMPRGVTTIGSQNFSGCSSLLSLKINNQVTTIKSSTSGSTLSSAPFIGTAMETLELPSSLTTWNAYTLYGTNIKTITMPSSWTSVANLSYGQLYGLDGSDLTINLNATLRSSLINNYSWMLTSWWLPNYTLTSSNLKATA